MVETWTMVHFLAGRNCCLQLSLHFIHSPGAILVKVVVFNPDDPGAKGKNKFKCSKAVSHCFGRTPAQVPIDLFY